MILELEDLAPYLPYGLKIQCKDGRIEQLSTLTQGTLNIEGRGTAYGMFCDIEDIKPILRPLSQFYTTRNGYGGYIALIDFKDAIMNKSLPYKVFLNLIKNHFDVFGLLEEGLAIDINTIENEKE